MERYTELQNAVQSIGLAPRLRENQDCQFPFESLPDKYFLFAQLSNLCKAYQNLYAFPPDLILPTGLIVCCYDHSDGLRGGAFKNFKRKYYTWHPAILKRLKTNPSCLSEGYQPMNTKTSAHIDYSLVIAEYVVFTRSFHILLILIQNEDLDIICCYTTSRAKEEHQP